MWIGPTEKGGNGCLRYAISWFYKRRYEDIRYLLLEQDKPNESKNYCKAFTSIYAVRMRNPSIECKIVFFKTLAISKLVDLALITVISNHITDEVVKIQKSFIWHDSSSKIKH